MNKAITLLKKLGQVAGLIGKVFFAPLLVIVNKTMHQEVITPGELCFALWRTLVWSTFFLCVGGSIGVPTIIAYLFLADIVIMISQTTFVALSTN